MSDTPRTDAFVKEYWATLEINKPKWSDFTRDLERENAALRAVLKRWLKVADDCHLEQQEVGYSEYNITVGLVCDTRALLDAARKEAQP